MDTVFQLQDLKQQLLRHESVKGSIMAGRDWSGKKQELEKQFYLLRMKLIDQQITDLTAAKVRLESDYKKGVQIW